MEEDRPSSPSSTQFGENMLREGGRDRKVEDYYGKIKLIGEGSISSIYHVRKFNVDTVIVKSKNKFLCCGKNVKKQVIRRQDMDGGGTKKEESYALKIIRMDVINKVFLDELRNEIDILKSLDHPNILKAFETFERRKEISLILELCSGGDLHSRNPYSERQAASIVGKLLSAVAYMHGKNIIHRDLKFENIMFENKQKNAEIKVIDFGLSKKYLDPDALHHEKVGTIYTMAHELLVDGEYTNKADLWSVGVIAYMLLSGTKPFWGKTRNHVAKKITRGTYRFSGNEWSHLSKEAKKFVASLLVTDPEQRATAVEALKHAWLGKKYRLSDRKPSSEVMSGVNEAILSYADSSEFKRLASNVVAHKSTSKEIFQLRQAFDQYDKTNDGQVTFAEFQEALAQCGYSEEELNQMFESIDVNHDGVIYYTEFLGATLESRGRIEQRRLADAFDRMDSDDSGFITKKDLVEMLGDNGTEEYIDKLISEADVNNDGKISFEEFQQVFTKQKKEEIEEVFELEEKRQSLDS